MVHDSVIPHVSWEHNFELSFLSHNHSLSCWRKKGSTGPATRVRASAVRTRLLERPRLRPSLCCRPVRARSSVFILGRGVNMTTFFKPTIKQGLDLFAIATDTDFPAYSDAGYSDSFDRSQLAFHYKTDVVTVTPLLQ